jgi:hypothetical protein
MGLAKKLGIVVLLYVIIGFALAIMMHLAIIPPPGGLGGALNILYIIFQPITMLYFFIVIALGLYP